MAEERVFSIDLGEKHGTIYVIALWSLDGTSESLECRALDSEFDSASLIRELTLILSNGKEVWRGSRK